MFSNPLVKSFRLLLFPFAIIYGLAVWIRNWLYDKSFLSSTAFGLPVICVGNLSLGGTGKSPMVEYLVRLLQNEYKVATLSRGYKRKTRGYALANKGTTALDIGDEPLQFYHKFPGVPVAVGEERLVAIPQLLHDCPDTAAIILDDAFQHRTIKAGLNIVLTEYGNLFTRDFFLPAGDLRDVRKSYKRASVIVVTKCAADLDESEKVNIISEINPTPLQSVFFTTILYSTPYHITSRLLYKIEDLTEVLLVTGIANPRPLKKYLEDNIQTYSMMHYGDHHVFSIDDWKDIKTRFNSIQTTNRIILTTEKDAMRLLKFEDELANLPLYVIPIEHSFLFHEGNGFNSIIKGFINNFKQPI